MVKRQIVACFSHTVRLLLGGMNICFKCLALVQIQTPATSYSLLFISKAKRGDVLRNFTESSSTTLHFSDDELSVQSDLLAPSSLECSVKLFGTQIYSKVYDKLL